MPDLEMLRRELAAAQREVRRLTVTAMRPELSRAQAALIRSAHESARAQVKLRKMALDYRLSVAGDRPNARSASALSSTIRDWLMRPLR